MVFGMTPIAIGLGEGSETRAPMAIATIGGLLSSLFLTLVVVPVVYDFLDELQSKFTKKRQPETAIDTQIQKSEDSNAGGTK
jgi:HAE1 family hydrophobic/amphiphilic exporter-1